MPKQPRTLATSEQHLEDWIVEHLDQFAYKDCSPLVGQLIRRQMRCEGGIVDLLGMSENLIQVIELKKEEIDGRAVAQLLCYMKYVRSVFDEAAADLWQQGRSRGMYGFGLNGVDLMQGILVGHSFEKKAYYACYEAGIQMVAYSYNDGGFTFAHPFVGELYEPSIELKHLYPFFEQLILNYDAQQKEVEPL